MTPQQIQQLIPNRPPYLWIDDVVSVDGSSIHTRKFLDPELPIFKAHYPDFPVFPAALQCECAFQASAVLIAKLGVETIGKVPVVARANNLKFRAMARPGDMLDVHVKLEQRISNVFYLKGRILRADTLLTSLDFSTTATSPSRY